MTTHNESTIREAKPDWLFHLEQNAKKTYQAVKRSTQGLPLGLLSSATSPIIQTLSGTGSGLDFINALEADILFMVEGINDALRMQKLLSFRRNDTKKYAFWVLGSVDQVFDNILHYKMVFEQIQNDKNLWQKAILIFDKDYFTDTQRNKLMLGLRKTLNNNKIYIWESYHFESVLFSDLSKLNTLIELMLKYTDKTIDYKIDLLYQTVEAFVARKKQAHQDNNAIFENKVKEQILPRREKLEKMRIKGIVETENFTKEVNTVFKTASQSSLFIIL